MYKYVIADDEPLIRRGIVSKLNSSGMALALAGEASNGKQALELLERERAHILVTDMRMPVMDGVSLLKAVVERHPQVKVIVISGYTDFEYTREAIEASVVSYLFKPYDRLKLHEAMAKAIAQLDRDTNLELSFQTIQEQKERTDSAIDEEYLSRLLVAPNMAEQSFKSNLYRELEVWRNYRLLAVVLKEPIETSALAELHRRKLRGSRHFVLRAPSSADVILILLDGGQSDTGDATLAGALRGRTGELLPVPYLRGGISSVKGDWNELHEAYREALYAVDSRLLGDEAADIFAYAEPAEPVRLEWPKTQQLLFFVETGNIVLMRKLLQELFELIRTRPELSFAAVKSFFRGIVTQVRVLLNAQLNISSDKTHSASYETAIRNRFTMEAIESYIKELFLEAAGIFTQFDKNANKELTYQIQQYIDKNYDKALSLELFSEMFYKHPNYLSTIFKEKTGENFSEYIARIRIGRAKELLNQTDYKVERIAKQLGYENTKYFYRQFRKVTGMTPLEYRCLR